MPNVKLQSSDGEIFKVDVDIARMSLIIKPFLENLGVDDGEQEAIPLFNVNSATLKKVIEWSTHRRDDPSPTEGDENMKNRTALSSWDADFIKVDEYTQYKLTLAADYLDIEGLLRVICKAAANMIKGKTPEEIRKVFNMKNV